MTSADKYEHLTEIEHVRARSDMYIGGVKTIKEHRWIIREDEDKLSAEYEEVESNPGLEQCILELIINAADHAERCKNSDSKVTKIKIEQTDEYFSVSNNGSGVPIEINEKMKMYVPEMIFGNLRTSSNYNDAEKRTVGGRNGIGAKAANIFSKKFIIEIKTDSKKYYQEFSKGMTKKTEPLISKASGKENNTTITFYPDFKAFGMESFNCNDINLLIKKRVYDLSAMTGKEVSVYYNSEKLGIKDFADYMNIYIGKNPKVVYKTDRWEIGFAKNPYQQSTQISFVNAICTEDGGSHVNHVLGPVIKKITDELQKKTKGVTIQSHLIKDNVIIFIKSLIDNPSFSSQLKRKLETKVSEFGSKCEIPDDVVKKITKLGICDNVVEVAKAKEQKMTLKEISGAKKTRLTDIAKLDDAKYAGTSKSNLCTLILVEGDSAMTLAKNGIPSAGGSDIWGVFPLKGKFLNIRDATDKQLRENEEVISVNRILGLGPDMKDITKLRYGKVMIMTDSDCDGFHIRGLLINYFTFYWPEIVSQGLLECMITPIVKVFDSKNRVINAFYNIDDYTIWLKDNKKDSKTRIQYYKGLGTSNEKDAKEYFTNLASNRIKYSFDKKIDMKVIEHTFGKQYADNRKEWITKALENPTTVDYNNKTMSVNYFINREMVQYSIYCVTRGIPNIIDGLKPGQRKILHGCFKRDLYLAKNGNGRLKVSQLGGYVSDECAYHHGEKSLEETIVKMAQEFVGSGNLNLLLPLGAFGTREQLGKDAASARYIFTALRNEVKLLFNDSDNTILNYLYEDNQKIEPDYYVPIIPIVLLNGANGIGTGWSTYIPCFKLTDVIDNLKLLIHDENSELKEMVPYYKGFKGSIVKISQNKWKSYGCIKYVDNSIIEIYELPIGTSKQEFKEMLDKMSDDDKIKSYELNNNDPKKTSNDICFKIKLNENVTEKDNDTLIKLFKLESNVNGTNMMAFNDKCVITKYGSADDILWDFYRYRLGFYQKRKDYMIDNANNEVLKVTEQLKFISMIVNNEMVIFKKEDDEVMKVMTANKFVNITKLLTTPISKFTKKEIEKLTNELGEYKIQLETIKKTSIKKMWLDDLDKLNVNELEKVWTE